MAMIRSGDQIRLVHKSYSQRERRECRFIEEGAYLLEMPAELAQRELIARLYRFRHLAEKWDDGTWLEPSQSRNDPPKLMVLLARRHVKHTLLGSIAPASRIALHNVIRAG